MSPPSPKSAHKTASNMTNIAAPAAASAGKKKRFSKRNKDAWRKRIDISDVDAFLDEQRQAERIG